MFRMLYLILIHVAILAPKVINGSGLKDLDEDASEPVSFAKLPGSKFRIYRRRMKWDDALNYCSKCAGGFATFRSISELVEIRDLIYSISHFSHEYDYKVMTAEFGLDRRYWIGMRDHFPEEDVWKWVKRPEESGKEEKEALTFPWYINEPAHNDEGPEFDSQREDHCVAFVNPLYHLDEKSKPEKHTLDDLNCEQQYYFICEAEAGSFSLEYDLCKKEPNPDPPEPEPKGIEFNEASQQVLDSSQGKGVDMNVIEIPPFFSININGMVDDNDQSIVIRRNEQKPKRKRGSFTKK